MIWVFWTFCFFIVYTYLIYPVLIAVIARNKSNPVITTAAITQWPSVSVIIAVHNEQKNIHAKLNNLRQLKYQGEVEWVIVSDGSTDETNAYLKQQSDINFLHYSAAKGKPSALNLGVSHAVGDVIVFMDARQSVSDNALVELVKYFSLDEVGAVSGELSLLNAKTGEAENIGLYWRYEKWIRANESRVFSTAGATGALYAIRRSSYQPLDQSTLLDDFETPIQSLKVCRRTLFEPLAQAYDSPSESSDDELKRKIRTLTGNFQAFSKNKWLFNPFMNPIFIQFMSHKVFRLLVPYAMLGALFTSLLSENPFIQLLSFVQITFYFIGILALTSESVSRIKLFNFIKVFLQMNYAAVLGLYYYCFKNSQVQWKSS